MSERKVFDLEQRTTEFAKQVVMLCRQLSRNPVLDPLANQVVRSAGSIGANYREANDALGRKDFVYRLRIVRKEAKETLHWLYLLKAAQIDKAQVIDVLIKESFELKNIFSKMIINVQNIN